MSYVIEKGIPYVPKRGKGGDYNLALALVQMEVGDSVFVPDRKPTQLSTTIAREQRRTQGMKRFSSRTVSGGTRVWRLK